MCSASMLAIFDDMVCDWLRRLPAVVGLWFVDCDARQSIPRMGALLGGSKGATGCRFG